MIRKSTIESFFEEGNPFTDLLPYFSYENGFFVLNDGSLGQVWQLTLIESETKSIVIRRVFVASMFYPCRYPYVLEYYHHHPPLFFTA